MWVPDDVRRDRYELVSCTRQTFREAGRRQPADDPIRVCQIGAEARESFEVGRGVRRFQALPAVTTPARHLRDRERGGGTLS